MKPEQIDRRQAERAREFDQKAEKMTDGTHHAISSQDANDEQEKRKQEKRRENRKFVQVYPQGWRFMRDLMEKDRNACRLYMFLAENIGVDGAVCVSRPVLAEALGMGERTVSRHIKTLVKLKVVVVLKVGTANVYCLRPDEVWRGFDTSKPYASFHTKTLVGKKENATVAKNIRTVLKTDDKPDFSDDIPDDEVGTPPLPFDFSNIEDRKNESN